MRSRLNDRLARATRFPIAVVCAPAGFGKTTALRDFVHSARLDAVRFDVRADDRTLLSFAHGLAEALGTVAPAITETFPAAQQRLLASRDGVADLTDWFDAHLRRAVCTIVIDDLHHAMADERVAQLVARLIELTRGRISWIIGTRTVEGLPIASWVGYGYMDAPIGEDELRFTLEEALAAASESEPAAVEEVDALHEFTDGWPLAVTIALRTRTYAADFPSAAAGARELIYRYLAEQTYADLSEAERELLRATSVFPTFDLAIIEALGGSADSIGALRKATSFLTPVGEDLYRYHDLFREFLEREVRLRGEMDTRLRRASSIVEARDPTLALIFATRSSDQETIVRIIEAHAFSLIEQGYAEVVDDALALLTIAHKETSPISLGAEAAIQAARGHFELAEPLFRAAIARSAHRELRARLAGRYAIELVRAGLPCEEAISDFAFDAALPARLRVTLLGTLATSFTRSGDVARGASTMEQALALLDVGADDHVRARLLQQAVFVFQFSAPDRAMRYAELATSLAVKNNLFEVAARAYSGIYSLLYERDDALGALAALDRLLECARKGASNQVVLFGLIAMFGLEVERGNQAAIETLAEEIERISAVLPRTLDETLLPARAMLAAWSGDFETAYLSLAQTAQSQPRDDFRALRFAEIAFYASSAAREEAADEAIEAANAALKRANATPRTALANTLLALAELARGRTESANRYIEQAERTSSPSRRVHLLANAARLVFRIRLGQATSAELAGALERLRAENFGGYARLIGTLPVEHGMQSGYALLTQSERAILELLARGASTKDVASQTGRSPQTVDTHIRSICRKLGCSGRRAAVALAHAQGWVKG